MTGATPGTSLVGGLRRLGCVDDSSKKKESGVEEEY